MFENEYYKNPRYCQNCGKIIPFEKRFGVGCCRSCSISIGNRKKGHHTEETKHKISETLHKRNGYKIKYCKYCGQPKTNEYDHSICKKHQIFNSLEKFGFDKSKIGSIELFDEYNRIKELITNWYLLNNSNEDQLKHDFNYTSGSANFHKLLKSLEIKRKSYSEAIKDAIMSGRLQIIENYNQFKSEWHTTWNGKEVFLRSSYETDYAKELDEKQIDYDVEALRIKYFDTQQNEYRCAIPDFYIPSENLIVEIKSEWTLDIQNMKDKIKAYNELGYKVKVICEHKEINL